MIIINYLDHPITQAKAIYVKNCVETLGFRTFLSPQNINNEDKQEKQRKLLQDFCDMNQISWIIGIDDYVLNDVSLVAEKLNLKTINNNAVCILSNKINWGQFCLSENIPIPKEIVPHSLDDLNVFGSSRVCIKPERGSGGDYCRNFQSVNELIAKIGTSLIEKNNSTTMRSFFGKFLVQEFINHKDHFFVNMFIVHGEIFDVCWFKSYDHSFPNSRPFAYESYHNISEELRTRSLNIIKQVYKKLNVDNIFSSVEFMLGPDDELYLIDPNPRLGGYNEFLAMEQMGYRYIEDFFSKLFFKEKIESKWNQSRTCLHTLKLPQGKLKNAVLPSDPKITYSGPLIQDLIFPEQPEINKFQPTLIIKSENNYENLLNSLNDYLQNITTNYSLGDND